MPRCEDAIGVLQMGPSATFILETLRPVTFHGSWLHRGANKDKKKSKDEEANAEADAVEAVMLANTLLAKKATYDMLRAGQLNMLDKAWECLDKVRCHLTAPITTPATTITSFITTSHHLLHHNYHHDNPLPPPLLCCADQIRCSWPAVCWVTSDMHS